MVEHKQHIEPHAGRAAPVVGRLAPSPTGLLHLGHAFSLLLAWWSARSQNGRVVLRLDDIDNERADASYVDRMIEDLKWLGLDWDDRVVASDRAEAHGEAVARLLKHGRIYPCVCSRRDVLRALGAPQVGQAEIRYPGTCRHRFSSQSQAEAATGKAAALRFLVPDGPLRVHDELFGTFEEDVAEVTGDFIVQRRSGFSAYQLAVVVDDHLDGVTEVVRGRDLLSSTLRQNLLARALELPIPAYMHVPLICDKSGQRLAKRDHSTSLRALREQGIPSEDIVSWVAQAANQLEMGETRVSARQVLDRFDRRRLIPRDVLLPETLDSALGGRSPIVRI